MLPRELPRELVHSIFDHLSDDIESLNNCAVVCRSWTYPCVERLLRIGVVFDLSQPRIESLEKLISTDSHLSESIISVKFVVRSPQEKPPQDISNRLISLIQNLRHVRHVAFKSFRGSFIDDTFLPTIKDLLRRSTIESLGLVDVLVFFSDAIYELLLLPPNLNTLTLSNVGFSIQGIRIDPTVPMCRIPSLRTLTLASYTYETTLRGVCNIFKDEEGDSTIRHLLFSDIADPNLVIKAVSGSVEELTVLVHSVFDGQ
ncbi:hypothetical protein H0H93_008538 [Arthromyces matolae]|nr:hypothetical protein H0H93_008538 [Arthromyces matolae]